MATFRGSSIRLRLLRADGTEVLADVASHRGGEFPAGRRVSLSLLERPVLLAGSVTGRQTLRGGPAGPGGYRQLIPGPAEPHVLRDELQAAAASAEPLLTVAHLSDIHICDAQSPARAEVSIAGPIPTHRSATCSRRSGPTARRNC